MARLSIGQVLIILVRSLLVHVFEASERGRQASYKLTSTVMLYLVKPLAGNEDAKAGDVRLGGSMTRQVRVEGRDSFSHSGARSLTTVLLRVID